MKVKILFAQDYDEAVDYLNRLNHYFSRELEDLIYENSLSAPLNHILMATVLSNVCDSILHLALNEEGEHINYYDSSLDIYKRITKNNPVLSKKEAARLVSLSEHFGDIGKDISGAFDNEIDVSDIASVALKLSDFLLNIMQRIVAYGGPKYKSRLSIKGTPFNFTTFFERVYVRLRYGDGNYPYRYIISSEEQYYRDDNIIDVSCIQKYLASR